MTMTRKEQELFEDLTESINKLTSELKALSEAHKRVDQASQVTTGALSLLAQRFYDDDEDEVKELFSQAMNIVGFRAMRDRGEPK